jgi:hypothetical protein
MPWKQSREVVFTRRRSLELGGSGGGIEESKAGRSFLKRFLLTT